MPDQQLLFLIAKRAHLHNQFFSSTSKIAAETGLSQQSISRKLRRLQKQGMLEMEASPRGVKLRLTAKAIAKLKKHYLELKNLFTAPASTTLSGKLKIGLGEGAYYVSQTQYGRQFKQKLGFRPYPGTLNLIVDEHDLAQFLASLDEIKIKGFKTASRSFGPIVAFKISIGGKQKGAIIFPERTNHPSNEIEVIAPHYLRGKFKLKEGSKVNLSRK